MLNKKIILAVFSVAVFLTFGNIDKAVAASCECDKGTLTPTVIITGGTNTWNDCK